MILLFNFSRGNLEIWVKYTNVASVISKMVVVIAIPFFLRLMVFLRLFWSPNPFSVQAHYYLDCHKQTHDARVFLCAPRRITGALNNFIKMAKMSFNKKFKKHSPLASLFITLLLLFIIFVEVLELCHRPVNPHRQSLCRCHTVSDNFVVVSAISGLAPYPSICLILFCGLENSRNTYELSIYMNYTNC